MTVTSRLRTKPSTYYVQTVRKSDQLVTSTRSMPTFRSYMVDTVGGLGLENPVTNAKVTSRYTGPYYQNSSQQFNLFNYCDSELAASVIARLFKDNLNDSLYIPLDFQKNNSFELIPFLADIDQLLFLFKPKFWGNLINGNFFKEGKVKGAYGSTNWGLFPFFSDLSGLVSSLADIEYAISDELKNLSYGKIAYFKTDIFRFGTVLPGTSQYSSWSFNGHFTLQGIARVDSTDFYSSMNALKHTLDELGVHPDLKTVWDILPLSFVVDYFIPVGDSLESLHPRGWYNPSVRFTGTVSLKGELKFQRPLSGSIINQSGKSSYDVYVRRHLDGFKVGTKPPTVPDWKAPSFKELANTGYLHMKSLLGKSKKPIKKGNLLLII